MEWFKNFPQLDEITLFTLKQAVDDKYRAFSSNYGEGIETFFSPLQKFLNAADAFFTTTPWPIIVALIAAIAWLASRSMKIVAGSVVILMAIGLFGMWEDTMRTISMILVSTIVSILFGIPLGILMSCSDRASRIIKPILDIMQTMPSFVYLIPVVMLLGIGKVPGLIAVVIYAVPPIIRLTDLGIRQVDVEVLEAADAFGSSFWQKLKNVQIPLALPAIMAGINQTIMMALAMVVVAAMIGVEGLGQPVLKAIANQYFTLGILNGLAIVGVAVIFDRASQAYGKRLQKHLEIVHG
ncbi:proline/glycine betaine ABC transporter permease [Pseudogulbenkiania sp. MAI-1]|uniref:ABC transporter permease n=1 Tax=Pseudogulbenkiania sp. MAI-1 TaxID=990370 RepID=UPI00045EA165|nr:proline/glycine betaine ABC transporter permease [Pseudogulbenkiania sp. MAI-1]